MRSQGITAVLAVVAIVAAPIRGQAPVRRPAQGAWGGKTTGVGHYADVNGIKLYYETAGTGDADIFPPAHAVELFGLLGGGKRDGGWDGSGRPKSRLAILPGLTHYTIFGAPALAAAVIPFLDEPAATGR
jgi:hypothetical protein